MCVCDDPRGPPEYTLSYECVYVCNDLGDPPGHITLPPVATYTDEASPCTIWLSTTTWIEKTLTTHTHTHTNLSLCPGGPGGHHTHTYKHTYAQTFLECEEGQAGRGHGRIEWIFSACLKSCEAGSAENTHRPL